MTTRQPILETTPQSVRESFHCEVVRGRGYGARWHFHPEVQLTLVLKSSGYRVVGDNISPLTPGDLVLVGANLPHVWHQDERRAGSRDAVHAIVVRFREDFLGQDFLQSPEFEIVRRLFQRSARGLHVTGPTRDTAAALLDELCREQGFPRLVKLLEILRILSGSMDLHPISSASFVPKLRAADTERMQRMMRYIHENLNGLIDRHAVARSAALTSNSFSRFFKTRIGKTLPQYVAELRIGNVCTRLRNADAKIADIALECGFETLANFNRQFRIVTGMTPREYRAAFEQSAS